MQPVVELVEIGKAFSGVVALDGVDLILRPGRIHALVGENGAGKSTLLNVLAGILPPDCGEIKVGGEVVHLRDPRQARAAGVVIVHQEVDLFADLSVMENIGLARGLPSRAGVADWHELRRQTEEALATVGRPVAPDDLAGQLTPAQRQLVEIADAVSSAARVLILDEPTSSLSAAEVEGLFAHLRRFRAAGTAIVYVSHRFEEIFAIADEITVLRDGRRVWTGEAANITPAELIRHMVGRPVEATARQPASGGPVRFACRDLCSAEGEFAGVTLEVRGGEVLGLYGLVGAGRSEWAQAVFGLNPIRSGHVIVDDQPIRPHSPGQMARAGLAYVPEDRLRQGLCRGLAVRLNVVLGFLRQIGFFLSGKEETRRAKRITEQLHVRLSSLEQPIGTLSGGNQQKVVLGRWLERQPAVLILDEPTRGVDVGAREEIYGLIRALAARGKAIVLISSDLPEVLARSDRVGVFRAGRLIGVCEQPATAEQVAALALGEAGSAKRPETAAQGRWRFQGWHDAGLALFVAAFFLVMHLVTGTFLEPDSLRDRLVQAALLSFCALGAALVLIAGGLDISVGALMCLSAGVAGQLWEQGHSWPIVLGSALAIGATGGAINAGLSLVGRVHPIVVTLGTMSVYRGLTLWWLGQDVQVPAEEGDWVLHQWLGVPMLVWCGAALLIVAALALNQLILGRELYALGSNPQAARRAGISRVRVWLIAFVAQGVLAALAGLIFLARSGGLQPSDHDEKTLQAIAAAVVGGVAITGGRGSVRGIALGCLFLVSLEPACIALRLGPRWQQAFVGVVLLAAVLVDALGRRRAL